MHVLGHIIPTYLQTAELVAPHMLARSLLYDFMCVADIAKSAPPDSAVAAKALYTGNAMVNVFR